MSSSKSSSSDGGLSSPQRIVVQPGEAGLRLDKLLSAHPSIVSREMARRLIGDDAVRLNRRAASPSTRVRPDDVVEFSIPPPVESGVLPQAAALDILHEDKALVVVNKPAGLSMHPGPGHPDGTLVNFLLHHCKDLSGIGGRLRPGIVHRLDKDTSGVVVVAKHDRAHAHLAAQFKAHSIGRAYLALVIGQPPANSGTIDLPLGRHPIHRIKRDVRNGGKRAVTHWAVEKRMPPFCLLRLRLETGRTHQIRVHLAARNWPVAGDPLYGGARHKGLKIPQPWLEALERFGRQALHACELQFVHPESAAPLSFSAPLPVDMEQLVELVSAPGA